MALSDLTFKFYTDTGLTSAFSGLYQILNRSDFSDNPQDFVLYFGSAQAAGTRTLQAVSNPGVDQITLTPADIEQVWTASTSYALGALIEPTSSNGYVYKCTTAGTSSSTTQPTWPTSVGSTVTDNSSIVWTCYAPAHPTTEIKLALTGGSGLSSATGGAPLNLGTSVNSGSANCIPVHIRITNTVSQVNNNTGFPQLGISINTVQEVAP